MSRLFDYKEIAEMVAAGVSQAETAVLFGCSRATVNHAVKTAEQEAKLRAGFDPERRGHVHQHQAILRLV
jgi:hypothetical protein